MSCVQLLTTQTQFVSRVLLTETKLFLKFALVKATLVASLVVVVALQ